jgi:two-component system, OmpR family, sensor histidine kinase BaeS
MGQNINEITLNLQRLDNSRRRRLAEISHELRTPLSVLIGELDVLKDGVRPLNPSAVACLLEDAQRLERIVDDLHFLAVSDISATTCRFALCDAIRLIKSESERFAQAFAAAHIELQVDFSGITQIPVIWDVARIVQLMANLLSNSLRYTDSPGVSKISVSHENETVHIDVDDSAPGVPQEMLRQMFEPLFRADVSRARVNGGSGLGLAVCRSIALAHGGKMQATASSLGGLCMRITLPVAANHHHRI